MAGVTGPVMDVYASRTVNRGTRRNYALTDEVELTTSATGWQPLYAFQIPTGAVSTVDGIIDAVASGAAQAAVFKRSHALRHNGQTAWSIPSGATSDDNGSRQDNAFWGATMTYSGATASCLVRGDNGTVRWYGIFQRTVGSFT